MLKQNTSKLYFKSHHELSFNIMKHFLFIIISAFQIAIKCEKVWGILIMCVKSLVVYKLMIQLNLPSQMEAKLILS